MYYTVRQRGDGLWEIVIIGGRYDGAIEFIGTIQQCADVLDYLNMLDDMQA